MFLSCVELSDLEQVNIESALYSTPSDFPRWVHFFGIVLEKSNNLFPLTSQVACSIVKCFWRILQKERRRLEFLRHEMAIVPRSPNSFSFRQLIARIDL